ncbi:MAG: glycosyltransferase family 2 protein [Bdellovibrionota bacterium]
MKISVVTPVLNGERFLAQTIESVLGQQGDFELEYIIRDGGSTDNTLAIAKSYAGDPRVTVISERDQSNYDAIDKAMALVTGDIGCWINADDYYEPGTFKKVIEAFRRSPERMWLYGRCDIIDENNKEIRKLITFYKNILGWFYSYRLLLCENYINQPATFWKMDLWREVGGLSMQYRIAADYHLWLKMAQRSSAISVHDCLAHFRRCGQSISDNHFERQFSEELKIAAEYGGWLVRLIHRFNSWKTVTVYRLLRWKKRNVS